MSFTGIVAGEDDERKREGGRGRGVEGAAALAKTRKGYSKRGRRHRWTGGGAGALVNIVAVN